MIKVANLIDLQLSQYFLFHLSQYFLLCIFSLESVNKNVFLVSTTVSELKRTKVEFIS